MTMTTRRTALAMLGLGTATAVGAETFVDPPATPGAISATTQAWNSERAARAFENLAAEIRKKGVDVISLDLRASLSADTFADQHELTVKFFYKPEA